VQGPEAPGIGAFGAFPDLEHPVADTQPVPLAGKLRLEYQVIPSRAKLHEEGNAPRPFFQIPLQPGGSGSAAELCPPAPPSGMAPALSYFDSVPSYPIYRSVCFVDTAGPPPGKIFFQRFRFSNAGFALAFNIFEKLVDPFCCFFVLPLPVNIIFPGIIKPVSPKNIPACLRSTLF
jgi:hypothetical protein